MTAPLVVSTSRRPRGRPHGSIVLLAVCGSLLALSVNLSKAAIAAGLSALDFAALSSVGAAAVLLVWCRVRGGRVDTGGRAIAGYAALGMVSYAVPNIAQALVAGHVGAGFASTMLALTPLLTLLLSVATGTERVRWSSAVGISLGLVGTLILIAPRSGSAFDSDLRWSMCGLIAPASNAIGNLLRARFLRRRPPSLDVLTGVLCAASVGLMPAALTQGMVSHVTFSGAAIVACSAAVTAIFNLALFRLQVAAGSVRLSQVGYVAAAMGVTLSSLLFAERIPGRLYVAGAFVVAGIWLVGRVDGSTNATHSPDDINEHLLQDRS